MSEANSKDASCGSLHRIYNNGTCRPVGENHSNQEEVIQVQSSGNCVCKATHVLYIYFVSYRSSHVPGHINMCRVLALFFASITHRTLHALTSLSPSHSSTGEHCRRSAAEEPWEIAPASFDPKLLVTPPQRTTLAPVDVGGANINIFTA